MSRIYAYVRTSKISQNSDRQHQALNEYAANNDIKFSGVFEDKQSGKDFDRVQYQTLKEAVRPGDIIVVKELDRFGRNYEEIKKELSFYQSQGVKVRILDLPTLNVNDEALSALLNNLMVELLSYIAQKEREKIQLRVKEGLVSAKVKGIKLGRPGRTLPKDFEKYYKRWTAGEINGIEFSKLLRVSRATLYRYIEQYKKELQE